METGKGIHRTRFPIPAFLYFQQHIDDIAQIAAYDGESVTFSDGGEPLRLEGGRVSANFFSLLGVKPAMGRDFLQSEDHHGANPVVLLSDRFWRQRYSADPHIIGRTAVIDAEEFTVIGVLPRGFQFQGAPVDVWRSRIVDTRTFAPTSVRLAASYLSVVARLRPGVSADLLQRKIFSTVHMTLLVLWGAVVCLLIIACANVANLVLARATAGA
jgi:putative ABC transport system permease protein